MRILLSKIKTGLILTLLFAISTTLQATEKTPTINNKIYIGTSISSYMNENNKINQAPTYYDENDWNDNNASVNFFIGYNLSDSFALEFEYNQGINNTEEDNDDDFKYIPNLGFSTIYSTSKATYKSSSMFINAIAKHRFFEKNIVFLKFGLGYANFTNTVDSSYITISNNHSENYSLNAKKKENGLSYKVGLGYEFAFTQNHSILGDYNYIITPNSSLDFSDSKGKNTKTKKLDGYSKISVAYKYTF